MAFGHQYSALYFSQSLYTGCCNSSKDVQYSRSFLDERSKAGILRPIDVEIGSANLTPKLCCLFHDRLHPPRLHRKELLHDHDDLLLSTIFTVAYRSRLATIPPRAMESLASNLTKLTAEALHPYYPHDAIIADYAANEWSVPALLGVFFSTCAALFGITFVVARRSQPSLSRGELLTIMWFVLSGCIHIFFEGYYAAHFMSLGSSQSLIGQMWKEYAFSDSRYLTRDSFVMCMESVTAIFWGPGCLITAALVARRHPMRFPLQMIVSMGQFYGDVLYYATVAFDHILLGVSYSRPEPFYFWCYFFFMNFIWIVIPGYLIYQSASTGAKAFRVMSRLEASKKST
nr:3-beta-hydroxysteroid-delta(8),delta(7)-isomerase [Quercus suber]